MGIALGVVIGILATWLITYFYYRKNNQTLLKIVKGDKIGQPIGDVIIKPPTQEIEAHPVAVKTGVVTPTISHSPVSKAAAQKRLDEDTKRVGFVRGEVHQLDDGGWGIAWGGKYPL